MHVTESMRRYTENKLSELSGDFTYRMLFQEIGNDHATKTQLRDEFIKIIVEYFGIKPKGPARE